VNDEREFGAVCEHEAYRGYSNVFQSVTAMVCTDERGGARSVSEKIGDAVAHRLTASLYSSAHPGEHRACAIMRTPDHNVT
jgi:hypothetical protein